MSKAWQYMLNKWCPLPQWGILDDAKVASELVWVLAPAANHILPLVKASSSRWEEIEPFSFLGLWPLHHMMLPPIDSTVLLESPRDTSITGYYISFTNIWEEERIYWASTKMHIRTSLPSLSQPIFMRIPELIFTELQRAPKVMAK